MPLPFSGSWSLRGKLVLWFLLISTVPMLVMVAAYVSFLTSGLEDAVGRRLAAASTGVQIQIQQHEQWLQEELQRHASQALLIRSVAQQDRESLDRLLHHFLGLSRAALIGLADGRGGVVTAFRKIHVPGAGRMSNPNEGARGAEGPDEEFRFEEPVAASEWPIAAVTPSGEPISIRVMQALDAHGTAISRTLEPGGVQITAYHTLEFAGRRVGVLYEGLRIDQDFVDGLKRAFGLDVAIVTPGGRPVVSSLSSVSEMIEQHAERALQRTTIEGREFFSTRQTLGAEQDPGEGVVVLLESREVLKAGQRRALVFFVVVFGLIGGTVSIASVAIANALTRRQRAAEEALETSRASFRNVVEKSAEGIIIVDRDHRIRFVNPCAKVILGDEAAVRPGQQFHYALTPNEPVEVEIVSPKGGKGVGEMFAVATEWEGQSAALVTVRDITDRKRAEEIIQHQAFHDTLTQLPNRLLFIDRLTQELSRRAWDQRPVAVLFLDLDQFKQINDTLGHSIGDALLRSVAERLLECLREGDTIARLGGDEFTMILADLAKPDDIADVARKILGTFGKPFRLESRELFVTASIGISVYPADGETAETLIKHADTAMYRAKEHGRNTFQFYVPAMNAKVSARLALETALRHAIERREFELVYQPQVDLRTAHLVGVEALLRWHQPDGTVVGPDQFIPIAEETGLIVPIGEWVLRTACRHAASWRTRRPGGIRVAVNISERQFRHGRLVESVRKALESTNMDPRDLELELTESIIQNAEATISTLRELSGMHIHIAIDDFGTGYSSLSYLNRFPINKLKIDRSFVMDIPHRSDGCSIVNAIVTLAHSLRLKAVAEGVSLPEQIGFLRGLHCDIVQGFLVSRPLSVEAIGELVASDPVFADLSGLREQAA